ncbi:MAG TPA: glutamine synthetase family protein [bacterium]|nr:glutamine synthetase family protein [bacterium]HRR91541.1 glutamine synthetase family protein [bacterium]
MALNSFPDTEDEILKYVKENNIYFIEVWFTDILGYLKSFAITEHELRKAFEEGLGFDGSAIRGFTRIDESDMMAIPEPETFTVLPWRPEERKVARIFATIVEPNGTPYEGDPRNVLKKALQRAKNMGFNFYVGPELEYFYIKTPFSAPELLDFGGYFDLIPRDEAIDIRHQTVIMLEKLGIDVESSHHEGAPSQHEIDFRYDDAMSMADAVMTARVAVKEAAYMNGVYATFMPKPFSNYNGSGMHVHMSLFGNGHNAFFDQNDKFHLSSMAKYFIAGLMRHAPEITLITNQWINSYKRLVPGYEAPVYISWALRNRSDLIRVPMYKVGKEEATRVEYRAPDPSCNPYLAFAVILSAGLEGIEKEYPLPDPVEENVYFMSEEERKARGIDNLPGSLIEAIEITENSELVKKTLGEHVFKNFIDNKKIEWDNYRKQVTSYELKTYLPLL